MRPQWSDLTVFVSLFAAILSGTLVVDRFGLEGTVSVFALTGLLAALWTVYFRFAVIPRLRIQASEEGDGRARASDGSE